MSKTENNNVPQEDTLIKTGLRSGYFNLVEGVYDPGILKAVFLAGGPGSGKSAVAMELFDVPPHSRTMSNLGLKVINSDREFEHLLVKGGHGLNLDKMPDDLYDKITSDDPSSLRSQAKRLMQKRFETYKSGRIGVIVDGTGDDYFKIAGQKKELQRLGYDCYMVYVNTTLEVAQARNMFRARKLKPKLVQDIWIDVQKNLGDFQKLFGKQNIEIIDNSEDTRSKDRPGRVDVSSDAMKSASKFIAKPIKNPIGKKWVNLMLGADKTTKSGDKLNRKNESIVEEENSDEVRLPMDLERYLSRTIHIIEKFDLNPRRNLAVLTRLVEGMDITKNHFVTFVNKIKVTKFEE